MGRQRRLKEKRLHCKMKTLQQGMKEIISFKPIRPHKLVNFIGLLCARTLCPYKEILEKHPSTLKARYMPRKRFEELVRFLHFSHNSSAAARKFKTWQIKLVAETINQTFKTIRVRALAGCARREASDCDNQEGSESSAVETGSASSGTGVVQSACI
ncbi:hypothetical protein GQ600_15275 [Phytophthora cactorum]|nr:hypothetical protein GQ600_15275 [Phytophthora cactorum]